MKDSEKFVDIKVSVNWRALKARTSLAVERLNNSELRASAVSAFLSICVIAGSIFAYSQYQKYLDAEKVIGQISCGGGQSDHIFFEEDGLPIYQSDATVASEARLWYGPARDSRTMAIPGSFDVVINNRGEVSARSISGDDSYPITITEPRGYPFTEDKRYSVNSDGDIRVGLATIYTEPLWDNHSLDQLCDQVREQYSQGQEAKLLDGTVVGLLPDNPTLAKITPDLIDYDDQKCPGWEFATLAPWYEYTLKDLTNNPITSGKKFCSD